MNYDQMGDTPIHLVIMFVVVLTVSIAILILEAYARGLRTQ